MKDFVEDDEERDIRMRIKENGDWDGVLKLRQGDDVEIFDIEIEVEENDKLVDVIENIPVFKNDSEIISLNGVGEVDELIYVSKDQRVIDWLPYGFSLFLIFIIGILLWERF